MQKVKNLANWSIILYVLVCISCKKNSTDPPMYGEIWPQKWVMTIDHDAANWKYLQVSGNSIDRTWIPRDFSLKTVADEKECEFIVNKEGEKNGKTMYSFTLAKNKNKRWTTTPEGSLLGTLEYRLSIENRS
ncbi:MAG: hypothetical protein ACKVOW_15015 [Chitinophagaceae bacterium]